jgi:general secretion pathway protein A
MLSNFETSREKLLQIILIGQPELEQKLEKHSLRQLKQRIATRAVIRPLTAEETRAYIEHRTDLAGGEAARLFTPGALQQLVRQAKGSPRTVNILCANALIAGVGYGRTRITKKIVKEVVRDLSGSAGPTFSGIRFTMAAAAVILLGMTVAYAVHSILVHPVAAVSEQEPHSGESRESPEEISASAMIPRPGSPAPEKAPPPPKKRNGPGRFHACRPGHQREADHDRNRIAQDRPCPFRGKIDGIPAEREAERISPHCPVFPGIHHQTGPAWRLPDQNEP